MAGLSVTLRKGWGVIARYLGQFGVFPGLRRRKRGRNSPSLSDYRAITPGTSGIGRLSWPSGRDAELWKGLHLVAWMVGGQDRSSSETQRLLALPGPVKV